MVDLSQRKFIGYGDNGDIFRGNFAEKKRGVKHFPIKKATRRFCFPNFLTVHPNTKGGSALDGDMKVHASITAKHALLEKIVKARGDY